MNGPIGWLAFSRAERFGTNSCVDGVDMMRNGILKKEGGERGGGEREREREGWGKTVTSDLFDLREADWLLDYFPHFPDRSRYPHLPIVNTTSLYSPNCVPHLEENSF